ncbi:MAG: phytoene/squalene synthase family protein [Beijerinckiaceae bacterium]
MIAEQGTSLAAHYDHCGTLVHEHDRDRWLASLFAPAEKRPHLHALYAFNIEIARIRDVVSDPMPGEIRLQWWSDALEGETRGEVRAHPVADALLDTVTRFQLPRVALAALIEAHRFDLYGDPMPDIAALEDYCEATSSVLFHQASRILARPKEGDGTDLAARHAGVAYAITGQLRNRPRDGAQALCFLPADLLAKHGVSPDDITARRASPGLRATLAELRALARAHAAQARASLASVASAARAAFLPIVLVPGYLDAMERGDDNALSRLAEVPQWLRQWRLWRASRQF